ncbi:hypothetical protein PRIPAC_90495, partial [Pristionchus pacificus]|uniref:Abnormal cell migration protein 18-like fibronectin type I domain-containing protein n=1 Tax=Pristionchus pacificus TaxID=54126 RepID=A0A8R1V7E7_PRIPA
VCLDMKLFAFIVLIEFVYGFDLETMLEKESKKECSKNGKNYRFGEEWNNDHMRYKCGKWGMYEITGCQTAKGRRMEKGEIHVDGNIVRGCTEKGMSVGYKESICGMWGAPECNEIVRKWKDDQGSTIGSYQSKSLSLHDQPLPAKSFKQSPIPHSTNMKSKKNSGVKYSQPKVEWFTSPNGKVKSGKISYKSSTSWEPEVTQLRTVTIKDAKVVEIPHSLDSLTVPVHTVMRMAHNRRMTKMKRTVNQ